MIDNVFDWYPARWSNPEPPVEQESQKSVFLETPCRYLDSTQSWMLSRWCFHWWCILLLVFLVWGCYLESRILDSTLWCSVDGIFTGDVFWWRLPAVCSFPQYQGTSAKPFFTKLEHTHWRKVQQIVPLISGHCQSLFYQPSFWQRPHRQSPILTYLFPHVSISFSISNHGSSRLGYIFKKMNCHPFEFSTP